MTYRYKISGKFLVCIDQPITTVVRRLLIDYNKCHLESLGLSRATIIRLMKSVALSRVRPLSPDQCVTLTQFGHLGMQVHRGIKLFDFKRSEVTKVFDNGVSREEADAEIASSKAASGIRAAPRFLMADSDAAWFKEEYVCGTHATDLVEPGSSDYLQYYPAIEACLLELAGSSPVASVPAKKYIRELGSGPYADRWRDAGIEVGDLASIKDYVEALQNWLLGNVKQRKLRLVTAHGDFSLVNTLLAEGELRIIDWDGIQPRSAMGDMFNFALAEHYYERTSKDFVAEAVMLFDRYRDAFVNRHSDLEDAVSMGNEVALRLYYLERIRLMLDRDVTPNINRVVQKSIKMFRQFDEDLELPPL